MPEQWQEELMKLRREQLPPGLWARVEAGSSMPPLPPSPWARARIVLVVLGALVLGVVIMWRASAPDRSEPGTVPGSNTLTVPPVGAAAPAFLSDGHPVFVVHHEDGSVSVIDAFSAHLHHVVGWCPSSRTLYEAVGGYSEFDEYGRYMLGPAPTGLATYRIEPVSGSPPQVEVIAERPAPSRGAGPRIRPAGPFCQKASELVVHAIPPESIWRSPTDAISAAPPGWIAVRLTVAVRGSQPTRVCERVEGRMCFSGRGASFEISGVWLARVRGGHLVDLTETIPEG